MPATAKCAQPDDIHDHSQRLLTSSVITSDDNADKDDEGKHDSTNDIL